MKWLALTQMRQRLKIIVTHSTTTDFTEPKLNNMTIENADNIDSSIGLININVDT